MKSNKNRTKVFYTGLENVYPGITLVRKRKEQRDALRTVLSIHFHNPKKTRWHSWKNHEDTYDFLKEEIDEINNF